MPITPITDFGTAVITGVAAALAALFSALPSIIGAILLLAIGWWIAGWIGKLVAKALRAIRFDQLAERAGVNRFLQRARINADPAGVLGEVVKWYVRLVFVLLAANAVGLTAVSTVVNGVLAFIPNLLVAVLILGLFSWLAGLTRDIVRGALGGGSMPNGEAIAAIAYGTVFAFGIVAAANQIGVASTLINTLFTGVVAAVALAFGLAFGLGGREQAAQIWADWRGHASEVITTASDQKPQEETTTMRRDQMTAGNGRTR
ncbi:MAG TPA: hypothetical protein VM052_00625 [Candidatus Limnocylindrales bacterium]|nr:hypothetical protein [Candidatus Limnocylindrales bacterium]